MGSGFESRAVHNQKGFRVKRYALLIVAIIAAFAGGICSDFGLNDTAASLLVIAAISSSVWITERICEF